MRRPLRNKGRSPQSQTTSVQSLPAPVGGWNARDSLAAMESRDAIYLRNFFPTTTDCVLRGGHEDHGTFTGYGETLAVYNRMNGTNAMFVASDTDVYDVTSAGAGSAQSLTVTNGKFQHVNFGDGTNNWLIMVNGTDSPKYFNGTSWVEVTGATSPALTGPTLTDLVHVSEYQGRLFFLENNSLSFWYLPAGAAGGTLTEFDLSSFADKGGYLMWMATWSFDGGDGPDDYLCFMTSEGQAIVYRGVNPSSATTWTKVGTYNLVGKPFGRRSYIKYEGDIVALTHSGAFPLSKALGASEIDPSTAVTDKINKAFTEAAQNYRGNFGWEITTYPLQNAMIFNIPVSETTGQKQYVMNTITKAWCEFDSWDAQTFCVFNDELYFSGNGVVQKAWVGRSDDGDNIIGEGKCAFNYFGQMSQLKRVNMFRPMLQVNGDITFLTDFDVDFKEGDITGEASYSTSTEAAWDTALWDTATWTTGLDIVRKWTSPNDNVGYCVAGKLKVNTNTLRIHWVANDYVYETGGIIG